MESYTEEADERLMLRARVQKLEGDVTKLRIVVANMLHTRHVLTTDIEAAIDRWSKVLGADARQAIRETQP